MLTLVVNALRKRQVTLYVMSSKNVESRTVDVEKVTVQNWDSARGGTAGYRVPLYGSPYHDTITKTKTEFVLPEDQKRIVEMVEEIALKHGLEVEVIDVAKESLSNLSAPNSTPGTTATLATSRKKSARPAEFAILLP